jgi:hypothetical protein
MSDLIRIEVQDQHGNWQYYGDVSNVPTEIKRGMKAALKTSRGKKSKKQELSTQKLEQ